MPLGHEPPSSCLTGQKRSPGPDGGLQKSTRLRTHPGHAPATAQERPVDSRESSSALHSTSWTQPPAREEHRASGLCWEVPVSLRHCSRTGRSSGSGLRGLLSFPRAGPEPGTGGRQPRSATLLFVYQAGRAAGLLSPQPRSLPASRPARDKGACGGLAARRAGPRFPRRQLLGGLAKAAVLVRAPFAEGGARPARAGRLLCLSARLAPSPPRRAAQARLGAAGSAADNRQARARVRPTPGLCCGSLVPMG